MCVHACICVYGGSAFFLCVCHVIEAYVCVDRYYHSKLDPLLMRRRQREWLMELWVIQWDERMESPRSPHAHTHTHTHAHSHAHADTHARTHTHTHVLWLIHSNLLYAIHDPSKVWNNYDFFSKCFHKKSLMLTKAAFIWSLDSKNSNIVKYYYI